MFRNLVEFEIIDRKQLKMGIEVEKEHTQDEALATKIAVDHLLEIPDYYTRLKDMEKNARKVTMELNETFLRMLESEVDELEEKKWIPLPKNKALEA